MGSGVSFIIIGLPRSRTAWFSAYFSACGHPCIHEGIKYCKKVSEYSGLMKSYEGDSTCAGALHDTDADKVVIINRDVNEVFMSLMESDVNFDIVELGNQLNTIKSKMSNIDGLIVNYNDINNRLQEIHEYCVDTPFDPIIGEAYMNMKIELIELFTRTDVIGELSCH